MSARQINITAIRAITRDDIAYFAAQSPSSSTPKPASMITRIRDKHHVLARLLAIGYTNIAAADAVGYTAARVCQLRAAPAFQELIEHYRNLDTEAWLANRDHFYESDTRLRNKSATLIEEQLDDALDGGETIPLRDLLRIHDSTSDRTGYGKVSTQINYNVDFAARLEKAIAASKQLRANDEKTIDHEP